MMEGAFFVSRTELIEWVNRLLSVNLSKVEQCASGAIYCQILDATHPGSVKMNKVNWMAKSDHEFIPNYKILQAAFDRNHIEKYVDVDKLIRGKYQDNLEFLQWMKAMWDREGSGVRDYDPACARDGRPVPLWANAVSTPLRSSATRANSGGYEKENMSSNRDRIKAQKAEPSKPRAAATLSQRGATPRSGTRPSPPAASQARSEELQATVKAQTEEIAELRGVLDGLEHERDYYFRKLRNVEILCETIQAKDVASEVMDVVGQVQGILYADEDNDDEAAAGLSVDASPALSPEPSPQDAGAEPVIDMLKGVNAQEAW
jgi:RP/EB family microtubule-associated protein